MTLYQEVLLAAQNKQDLKQFYRFEGGLSYNYLDIENNTHFVKNYSKYTYFSNSLKHHKYYLNKRLSQLLKSLLNSQSVTIIKDLDIFNILIDKIYTMPIKTQFISLECSSSKIFEELLYKNSVLNSKKNACDRRVERCDTTKYQGGYGLCDEWLRVFEILTYFFSYKKISVDDLAEYFTLWRMKILNKSSSVEPASFLTERIRIVKMNQNLYNDYTKYELLNLLQTILENKLYFPGSYLDQFQEKEIKHVITSYSEERQQVLKLTNSIYKKTLAK